MAGQTDMELIKNGVRLDGRKPDELREVKIVAGVLSRMGKQQNLCRGFRTYGMSP